VEYQGIINAFSLAQRPRTNEEIAAKMRAARLSGLSFGGPQVEPDPESVKVSFHLQKLESFGEITITKLAVRKFHLMVEDAITISIDRRDNSSSEESKAQSSNDVAQMQGTISAIMADPASPVNRIRAYESLSKMYPFFIPQGQIDLVYKATEQEGIEKPSELVRLEIWNQTTQAHGTMPIRKKDLEQLGLFTGDLIAVTIDKNSAPQKTS